jgi:hypothetical protein
MFFFHLYFFPYSFDMSDAVCLPRTETRMLVCVLEMQLLQKFVFTPPTKNSSTKYMFGYVHVFARYEGKFLL